MKTMKLIFICILFSKCAFSQDVLILPNSSWEITHFNKGSCYFDTLIHAIWVQILPQQIFKFSKDTSFVIAKVEIVNKSPKDIYLKGVNYKLKVPIIQEWVEKDTSPIKENEIITSAGRFKFRKELAFTPNDYKINPFKELWRSNKNQFLEIKAGRRMIAEIAIPKREGSYRIETIVEFNKEKYWYDCNGTKVSWSHLRTIESNKIDLIKNYRQQ